MPPRKKNQDQEKDKTKHKPDETRIKFYVDEDRNGSAQKILRSFDFRGTSKGNLAFKMIRI